MELQCESVVSGLGCEFVARGGTPEEVKMAMMAHGDEAHSDLLEGIEGQELEERKRAMETHILALIQPPR